MARFRSALALISICIVVGLSGLGDCRLPFQREQLVGQNEQNVHLLLPTQKDESNEIARETQPLNFPLERPDLRGNDGIFQGERSRGLGFGRPGGCHHGKFKLRGQRKSEHNMFFPLEFPDVQAESRDSHPRMDRPLPEKSDFDPAFSMGEWRQHMPGHPGEEKKEREKEHIMPFPPRRLWPEFIFHLFPGHAHPKEFHPRVDQFGPEFGHGFPKGGEGRQHRDEKWEGERNNEHMPFFPQEQKEYFPEVFPVQESIEFRSKVEEFLPLPRERDLEHGFLGGDGRHGHGGQEKGDKEDEHIPFPTKGERRESFSYTFPVQAESTEFHSRVEQLSPLPGEEDMEHSVHGGEEEKGEEVQH